MSADQEVAVSRLGRDLREQRSLWSSDQMDRAARLAVYAVATSHAMGASFEELLEVRRTAELGLGSAEVWNGLGPLGWAGRRLSLSDRVVSLASYFDNETMAKGRTEGEALEQLQRLGGTRFDPAAVLAFTRVLPVIQPLGLKLD